MNSPISSVDTFLSRLRGAGEKLQGAQRDIENKEEQILEALGTFASTFPKVPKSKKNSSELQSILKATVDALTSDISEWKREVEQQIKQREFVDKFDKSLIVIVYGKVKSGKSSLGNFIAGLDFKSLGFDSYSSFPVKITVHETAGKSHTADRLAEVCDSFEVKATEATNCIQEFTLGGMSWVDTPGIDALTEANVALAHEYVENAELAVYLTSSDSPVRSGDLQALARLLKKAIPTLLVISKFDEVIEDEDSNTGEITRNTVSKGEESRTQQQKWALEQIRDSQLEDTLYSPECLFISTMVAKEALLSGDAAAFESSGIPALYEKLGAVVCNDAIRLKAEKPKARVNALLSDLLEDGLQGKMSLAQHHEKFDELRKDFMARKDELREQAPKLANQIQMKLTVPLRELMEEAVQNHESGDTDTDLNKKLEKIVLEVTVKVVSQALSEKLRESMGDLVKCLEESMTIDAHFGELKRLHKTIQVSDAVIKKGIGSAIGGLLGVSAASVATILFPPLAPLTIPMVFTASVAGGAVGGAVGSMAADKKDLRVEIGLNTDEVRADLDKQLADILPDHTAKLLEKVCEAWFDPLVHIAEEAVNAVTKVEIKLQKLKYEVQK